MKVFVAIYEHKHGSDVMVFETQEGALAWKDSIALEWWKEEIDDNPPDIEAGDEYFDVMSDRGEEFFNIEEKEVLP